MRMKKTRPVEMIEFDEELQWLRIYAIYDKKGNKFDTPFLAHSDLFAKRRYMLMADEKGSPLSKWADEFELYLVAKFNIKTAKVVEEFDLVLEGASLTKNE